MHIEAVPAFHDNYIWILSDPPSDAVGVVDPGDAAPVIAALDARGWRLTHIFITHHHPDHIGGAAELQERYGALMIASAHDTARIPGADMAVGDGDTIPFGSVTAQVIATPGHTSQHICYWFAGAAAVFCGDTIFPLGCGRLLDGTAAQMWTSLQRLRALPPDTRVYCAHEYTLANAAFAVTIENDNSALQTRVTQIKRQRANGHPTVPSRLAYEIATNPFLRADIASVQQAVGMSGGDAAAVFAEIRHRKDVFKG